MTGMFQFGMQGKKILSYKESKHISYLEKQWQALEQSFQQP